MRQTSTPRSRWTHRFVAAALALCAAASAHAATVYGISNGFGVAANNRIYQIDTSNADLSNIVQVTVAGRVVTNAVALVANPVDNSLWTILRTTAVGGGGAVRQLATIDPATGVATVIGTLSDNFASLAFDSAGTLYGVTGDGATVRETLYTLNQATAAATFVMAFGNGADGETIAFHPDGTLYHSSGNTTALFESVNVGTQVVTPIGSANGEMFAMGWHDDLGMMFGSDISSGLFTINLATGARSFIGDMSDQLGLAADNRGFAVILDRNPVSAPAAWLLLPLSLGLLSAQRRGRAG